MSVIIPPSPVLVFHPELCPESARLRAFVGWWTAKGPFPIKLLRGNTTDAEQARLYGQGRWLPGTIVTNAKKASQSAHGHGAAIDAAPVREFFSNGKVRRIYLGDETEPAVRSEALARYRTYADIGERQFGLQSGRDFPGLADWPHLQEPEWESLPLVDGVSP